MPPARQTIALAMLVSAGLITIAAAVASTPTAAADPPPPVPAPLPPGLPPPPPGPAVPMVGAPLGPNGLSVLGQTGAATQPGHLGAPQVPGLDVSTLLGQSAAPAAPGAGPGAPPNLDLFNNGYGIQQNIEPAAPGQGQQFDVAPGQENANVSRREWLGRYIDMYRAGMLKGGMLGQAPQEQLGQPMPGTAPPPGTNIPPGLVQFLPPPPGAPGAPLPPAG
ncbi:hypothetical protein AB4Z42_10925 [Mycobacterium sp. 2YAF39]